MMKMILRVHSVAQVIMRHNQHSQPLLYNFFIVKIVLTDVISTSIVLNTSATTAYSMLLDIEYPTAHFIEAGDFNSSGG
jgi:hypothetical protein